MCVVLLKNRLLTKTMAVANRKVNFIPNLKKLFALIERKENQKNESNNNFQSLKKKSDEIIQNKLYEILELVSFSVWIKLTNFIKSKFMNLFQKIEILANIYKRKKIKLKVPPINVLLALLYLYKIISIHINYI
jgi:hypothetical protein